MNIKWKSFSRNMLFLSIYSLTVKKKDVIPFPGDIYSIKEKASGIQLNSTNGCQQVLEYLNI